MRSIWALATKDLRLLLRDRFGLFWVALFPLLMALFFGSIFSSGGSSSRGMKIAFIGEGDSTRVAAFRSELTSSDALRVEDMGLDSARELVGRGKLVAFVRFVDTSTSTFGMFGSDRPSIEVGLDPARSAEAGYLKGLVTQAYFGLLRGSMTNPSRVLPALDQEIAALDSASGLTDDQRSTLKNFLGGFGDFLAMVDSVDSTSDSSAALANSPFGDPDITFEDVAVDREGPRSTWEITFPQSLQWALIGVCAAFAVSIVVERRRGTFLRLRLAPIGRGHILAGKGLACFIASIGSSVMLLGIGVLVFGVRVTSPLGLVAAIGSAAFCFVGLMMFISVLGKTEQAVAGAGWAILLVMSMTGGGMVPLFAMPSWMLKLGSISMVKWSVLAMEGAIWRGFGPAEMALPVGILLTVGLAGFVVGTAILTRSD